LHTPCPKTGRTASGQRAASERGGIAGDPGRKRGLRNRLLERSRAASNLPRHGRVEGGEQRGPVVGCHSVCQWGFGFTLVRMQPAAQGRGLHVWGIPYRVRFVCADPSCGSCGRCGRLCCSLCGAARKGRAGDLLPSRGWWCLKIQGCLKGWLKEACSKACPTLTHRLRWQPL